ncbi:hypothetical protein MPER_08843 [Moniliophthora perniciosa FA553]|nr:hypothetical protein MPER_08843 [Moniliophthora perniciosa FA553]
MASKAEKDAATHYCQFELQWSSIALLFFDYALTFPMEVKYMWGTKPRLSTVLYVFCRYALVANVLYLLNIAKKLGSESRVRLRQKFTLGSIIKVRIFHCDTWYKIIGVLSLFGRAAVIVTFSARTYAIYGRNRWILAYLALLGLACVALDIMRRLFEHSNEVPFTSQPPILIDHIANELLSIFMVIFEYSSAILTTIRSVQAFRVNGAWRAQKGGFLYMIFEQGILYFSVISLFTTAAVVLNYRAPSGFFQRLLNALTLPLSGLLTARFLLHIREWEYKQKNLGTPSQAAPGNSGTATMAIIEDFGVDPVAVASSSKEAGLKQKSEVAAQEDTRSDPSHGSGSQDLDSSVKEGKKPMVNAGSFV